MKEGSPSATEALQANLILNPNSTLLYISLYVAMATIRVYHSMNSWDNSQAMRDMVCKILNMTTYTTILIRSTFTQLHMHMLYSLKLW